MTANLQTSRQQTHDDSKSPLCTLKETQDGLFTLTEAELSIKNLPVCFDGYRLVQLTDLHFGGLTDREHIATAVKIAKDTKPDIVLLTGDFVQVGATGLRQRFATKLNPKVFRWPEYRRQVRSYAQELRSLLRPLQAPDGMLAVFGNHEYHEGIGTIRRQLPREIVWLRNSTHCVARSGGALIFAGTDDVKLGQPDLAACTSFPRLLVPTSNILLSHNPDIVLDPKNSLISSFELMLSGHTHGGQICLPGGRSLITRTKQKEHVSGLSYFGNTAVYVNRGVGYGGLPIRTFCRPEVLAITLRCAK